MKFCPKCNDRMNGELCTTCDKDKLPERIKFSDYSNQKLNSCDKGCGAKFTIHSVITFWTKFHTIIVQF